MTGTVMIPTGNSSSSSSSSDKVRSDWRSRGKVL